MSEKKAHPFTKIGGSLAGLLVLLAALIAGNIVIKNLHIRADLTEDKRFSLSEGTVNTLKHLQDNVELQFYFSKSNRKVPMQLKTFAEQTEDFLREYERVSGGKVKLTVIDPKPDTDAEDQAVQQGLKGMPLDIYGAPLYMGLVVTAGKYSSTIPVIDPQKERFLEYDITRLIYQVTHPNKPVIGVLSSLPVLGDTPAMPYMRRPQQNQGWFVFEDLKKDYELRNLSFEDAENGIDQAINTLVLVHPKNISEKAAYAIDQFVLRGGHLIAFVDPAAYVDNSGAINPYMPQSNTSDLPRLFKAWGIKYNPAGLVVDRESGLPIREGNRAVVNHGILVYNSNNLNKDAAASANLNSLRAIFAGSLEVNSTNKNLTASPLIFTSPKSGTAPACTAMLGSDAMMREYIAAGAPLNIAMKLTGKFKTAFPDGAPEDDDTKDKEDADNPTNDAPPLKEGESTVVIIADVDILSDLANVEDVRTPFGILKQPVSNNSILLANLIDQLSGDQDLISIRSRKVIDRHFTRVEKLRKAAQIKFEDKIKELQQQLQDAQRRINELEQQKTGNGQNFVSNEQRAEIRKFMLEKRRINKQMRQVQKDLRKDIDKLGNRVKLANIALIPLLIILAGIFAAYRKRKK